VAELTGLAIMPHASPLFYFAKHAAHPFFEEFHAHRPHNKPSTFGPHLAVIPGEAETRTFNQSGG
jgi:hypothetical protein